MTERICSTVFRRRTPPQGTPVQSTVEERARTPRLGIAALKASVVAPVAELASVHQASCSGGMTSGSSIRGRMHRARGY